MRTAPRLGGRFFYGRHLFASQIHEAAPGEPAGGHGESVIPGPIPQWNGPEINALGLLRSSPPARPSAPNFLPPRCRLP